MNFPIDRTLMKIFDEAEEEFKDKGISRDQIKEAFYLFWYNAKQIIHAGFFPSINFPKWGRFIPKITALKTWMISEKNEENKQKLEKIINRINNENRKRK